MYAALNLARSSLQFKKKFVNEGGVINFDSESMRVIEFQTPSDTKKYHVDMTLDKSHGVDYSEICPLN